MLSHLEHKELKQLIQTNQHEVFIVSIDEFDAIIKSSPNGKMLHVQNAWLKIKKAGGQVACVMYK